MAGDATGDAAGDQAGNATGEAPPCKSEPADIVSSLDAVVISSPAAPSLDADVVSLGSAPGDATGIATGERRCDGAGGEEEPDTGGKKEPRAASLGATVGLGGEARGAARGVARVEERGDTSGEARDDATVDETVKITGDGIDAAADHAAAAEARGEEMPSPPSPSAPGAASRLGCRRPTGEEERDEAWEGAGETGRLESPVAGISVGSSASPPAGAPTGS